jgi:hypothetical protein
MQQRFLGSVDITNTIKILEQGCSRSLGFMLVIEHSRSLVLSIPQGRDWHAFLVICYLHHPTNITSNQHTLVLIDLSLFIIDRVTNLLPAVAHM